MEFCPKCGKLLKGKEENGKTVMVCTACGFKKSAGDESVETEELKKEKADVAVSEGEPNLPKTDKECPKCGHKKAYYWMEQTRSADEAPTRFYRCTKCGHTWREYS